MNDFTITVLSGGVSHEREVSLVSGRAAAEGLEQVFPGRVRNVVVDEARLPYGLGEGAVVFPVLHGTFGEDGTLQTLLETAGICYAGCGPEASRLCMNKADTKRKVAAQGVRVAEGMVIAALNQPGADEVAQRLGTSIVIKPVDQGSSVGLHLCSTKEEIAKALSSLGSGEWLAEKRIQGRELTIGILGGRALGIVEIIPKAGVYDYQHKYTKGSTEYVCPAKIAPAEEAQIRSFAETAFAACGCRDYARIDFILQPDGKAVFLEINTLPGLTPTSLLPKSAAACGHDFPSLLRAMVEPAIQRHTRSHVSV